MLEASRMVIAMAKKNLEGWKAGEGGPRRGRQPGNPWFKPTAYGQKTSSAFASQQHLVDLSSCQKYPDQNQ